MTRPLNDPPRMGEGSALTDVDRVRRTMTDPQRMLWADDVKGICQSPDMCFEYGQHVRCGPCAIRQADRAGVESDLTVPNLPEVYRLRRKIKQLEALPTPDPLHPSV